MSTRIIILGTGGTCVDILDTLHDLNRAREREEYTCVGFLDDDPDREGNEVAGLPVLGGLDRAGDFGDCRFINGIGSPTNFWNKPDIIARTGLEDDRFVTLVHPTASVSTLATLGPGSVVLANATVAAHAALGRHVVVLANAVVSHDVVVGDYSCLAAGIAISGSVHIGEACYLGSQASIVGGVRIGEGSLIGMGSVVLEDVVANAVMVGNPARYLRRVRSAD